MHYRNVCYTSEDYGLQFNSKTVGKYKCHDEIFKQKQIKWRPFVKGLHGNTQRTKGSFSKPLITWRSSSRLFFLFHFSHCSKKRLLANLNYHCCFAIIGIVAGHKKMFAAFQSAFENVQPKTRQMSELM
jgi:hypothetical protein